MISHIVNFLIFSFLSINLISRISLLKNEIFIIKFIFLFVILFCFFIFFFPRHLKISLFFFALSFPLYGWHSFSIYNLTFEFIVVVIAITLFFLGLKEESTCNVNNTFIQLFLLYMSLSFLSLFLLPIRQTFELFFLWGFKGFSNALFTSTPDSYLYSFAAINRLLLFFIFIYLLSIKKKSKTYYQLLFIGALSGGVGAALVGILNQYSVISLDWYQLWSSGKRLKSVFGNPGWFAEYICLVIPFILLFFLKKNKTWIWKSLLFFILIICEIAIILTGSRASWLTCLLLLMFCLLFFYLFKNSDRKGESWKSRCKIIAKVFIFVSFTILISIVLIIQILDKPKDLISTGGETQYQNQLDDDYETMLNKRLLNKRTVRIRKSLWKGGITLGSEMPIYGMGYESYRWHAKILGSIKTSSYYKNRYKKYYDTPHNTFIQIFISGGIVGLLLWISIIIYVFWILIIGISKEGNFINLAVMLSIIGFYLYGLVQSMQYISVIWFLHFLCIGYAMTKANSIFISKQFKFCKIWIIIVAIAVLISGVFYIINLESKNLAKKYGLTIYAKDQSIKRCQGFYHLERSSFGPFYWSGKKGLIKYDGQGVVEFKYVCLHPDVEKEPVMLSVYLNKEKIDFITFTNKGKKSRQYYFLNMKKNSLELLFEVSRTWNPRKYSINADTRDLGIGISPLKTLKGFSNDYVGFYHSENWETEPKGWPKEKPFKIRWTGMRASMMLKKEDKTESMVLCFLASHPNLSEERPVILTIYGDSIKLKELNLKKFWQVVKLEPKNLDVLTFKVNRTWNPKLSGVSSDNRDLGVAIAILN